MIIKFIDCTEKHYEDLGIIHDFLKGYLNSLNIENYTIKLSQLQIAKCTQCRCCTQKPGNDPIKCVQKDEMNDVLDEIESADAFIILADRNNLFSKNAVHAKFSERLVAYHYWPYGQAESTPRKLTKDKSSILINYNTTKYFMNHSFLTARKYMGQTSASIGAKSLDWEAITPKENLLIHYKSRLIEMADKLIASADEKVS